MKKEQWGADISNSLGAPFGGLGTGYFVYGRHGFVNWNVDGFPEQEQTAAYPHTQLWDYHTDDPASAPVALTLTHGGQTYLLQTRSCEFAAGYPCVAFSMHVRMPVGEAEMKVGALTVRLRLYSSVKPHDLDRTGVPACVVEVSIDNATEQVADCTLSLCFDPTVFTAETDGELLLLSQSSGQIAFGFVGGTGGSVNVTVPMSGTAKVAGAFGWWYPLFTTPGIAPNDIIFRQGTIAHYDREAAHGQYCRAYTLRFSSAVEAARMAMRDRALWLADIEAWHAQFSVPAVCSHVWFGSYASLITATLHTVEGYFFEIEQPHGCLNTMDVSVYSAWMFLINWPQIERQDLLQYVATIPMEGETAGKVWHSLWADGAHYVEEAIYAVRVWRYALWSGDRTFLRTAYPSVRAALDYLYRTDGVGHLIGNSNGNQSYDAWKMPGIGAYVDCQWLYALFALGQICRTLGEPEEFAGEPLTQFLRTAVQEYNCAIWNEKGYWHAYRPTEQSLQLPFGTAIFSDQLFGHWAVMIDPESRCVLDTEKETSAAKMIYVHNRITNKRSGISCWTNGMMPVREDTLSIDMTAKDPVVCGYHALTCWVSTQMELASILGYLGQEEASLDVFANVVRGMGNNVLAVGEWNRALGEDMRAVTLSAEPGKDTPRFPPYPRYKSSWEYLIRLLGLELTMDTLCLRPFHSVAFAVERIQLAGMTLSVHVEKDWARCLIDGKEGEPCVDRARGQATFDFVR